MEHDYLFDSDPKNSKLRYFSWAQILIFFNYDYPLKVKFNKAISQVPGGAVCHLVRSRN